MAGSVAEINVVNVEWYSSSINLFGVGAVSFLLGLLIGVLVGWLVVFI